ncbi:MAG: aspartate/glutamate racemase family protein [Bacillota bacterium]|nr:aspartate/glutamate racemase family protein [Bacillota bacterium]
MARYLVVNPVGTATWDAGDTSYLRSLVAPGDEVQVASLPEGPEAVDSEARWAEAEYGVTRLVDGLRARGVFARGGEDGPAARDGGGPGDIAARRADGAGYDAVLINCFADPGLFPGRELLGVPVLGAGETALALAPLFGEGVAVLAPDDATASMFARYARRLGLDRDIAGFFPIGVPVAALERRPELTAERVIDAARRARRRTGCGVVVLGCTGLAPLAARVASVLEKEGLTVLEPLALAFRAAEVLVRLGLCHHRGGMFAACRDGPGLGSSGIFPPDPGLPGVFYSGPRDRTGPDPEPVDVLLLNAVVSPGLLSWVPGYARSVVSPWTRVRVADISDGPPCIETFCQEAWARPGLVRTALQAGPCHAAVVNCFADPAVRALREATGAPVLGPAESSCRLALLLGRRFGVVSTGSNAGGWTEMQVREMGLAARCAGAVGIEVGVLALREDRGATVGAIVQEARRLTERGAEVIVLGCTGMAELAREVAGQLGMPVLEPLAVALNLADLVARTRSRQGQSR